MGYSRIVISEFGEPEVLMRVEEKNLPEPEPGEVRVRVQKTSANFTDVMIRKGKYPEVKEKPPFSPGYDMVGIVDKMGAGSFRFAIGDRVADLTVIGAYSEYLCLPENRLTRLPDGIDSSEAVALILSYITAYQMLHRVARLSEKKTVLVHGAAGAVGIALLQLGRRLDLKIYGTASKLKHPTVQKYGGIPIDYRSVDFAQHIRELEIDGIDAVFDPIGGENFRKSFSVLKPGGFLVAYGFYNAVMGKGGNIPKEFLGLIIRNILPNRRRTRFYIITRMRKQHPEWFQEDLTELFRLLLNGEIQPLISDHAPLDKAIEIHRRIERAEIEGKVIFDVS